MAIVTFYYLDGRIVRKGPGIRISKKNHKYWVWPKGPHIKGIKPLFSVGYAELHAVNRTGRKGMELTNDQGQKFKKSGYNAY